MAQYLIANWDYTAEGNFELSFKEGDKIKLLEKHNDDWWEGELNDQIGFFPANRAIPLVKEAEEEKKKEEDFTKKASNRINALNAEALSSDGNIKTISPNNPYHQRSSFVPETPKIESKENLLIDLSAAEEDLPKDWSYSYDQTGTIYFFNESTGESQWEKPLPNKYKVEPVTLTDMVYDMNRLNLEALHPNWIRAQSDVQIKLSSNKIECSWKDYYAVLTTFGFVLIYKENLSHYNSKRSSSLKPIHIFGTIDLRLFEITTATKSDTRKKLTLILRDALAHVTIFMSIPNESLYSEWSDAFMREKIAIQENRQVKEPDLVQTLGSVPFYSRLTENNSRKQTLSPTSLEHDDGHENETKPGSSLSRWLSRSNKNNNTKSQPNPTGTTENSTAKEIFGGQLKLDEDGNVPLVVRLCIEQVEARGLDSVGIYRLSGQTTSIQKYKAQFNTNSKEVDLSQENDINVITGLLKLYFRELKNPLLTFENYDRLIEAARLQDYDERMFRLKSIIQILPIANYKVLKYLIKHLETVSLQSQANKMEASNLALIFSMGLLRPKNDDLSASVLQSDLANKVIECMIAHASWFFDHEIEDEEEEDINSFNNLSHVV